MSHDNPCTRQFSAISYGRLPYGSTGCLPWSKKWPANSADDQFWARTCGRKPIWRSLCVVAQHDDSAKLYLLGYYSGGSTVIRPGDSKWFKKGSTRVAPNVAAPKRALSLTEQAALKAFQESGETGVRLIPKGETKKPKKRLGKSKARARNPPVIRPEPSLPQKDVAEIRQTVRRGKSRVVTVELSSEWKPQRERPRGGSPQK